MPGHAAPGVTSPPRLFEPAEPDLIRLARGLFHLGLLLSSLLAWRSLGGLTVGDLFLLASTLTLLLSAAGQKVVPSIPKVHLAVGLVVVAGVAAAGRSLAPASDLSVMLRLVYLVGVLPWQARALLPNSAALARATRFWLAGAAICAAGTLLQAKFGADLIPGAEVTNAGRYSGLAQTVSDTGGITAVAIAFCLGGLTAKASRGQRWLSNACLAICSVGLLLSGSVSGILAAAAAGLYLLVRRGISLRFLVLLAVAGVAALQLVTVIQHRTSGALSPLQRVEQVTGLASFATEQSGLNTSESRLGTDKAGLDGFARHPVVGSGLDTTSGVVDQRNHLQVHNLVIGAAYQGGVLLVIGLCIPIGMALRRGWRAASSSVTAHQVYASLVATTAFALTAPSDYNRYFWIPVALAMASFEIAGKPLPLAAPAPPMVRRPALVA